MRATGAGKPEPAGGKPASAREQAGSVGAVGSSGRTCFFSIVDPMTLSENRATLRVLRSAPAFGVAVAAASAGKTETEAFAAMSGLAGRGGCHSQLTERFDRMTDEQQAVAVAVAAWPVPAATRRSAINEFNTIAGGAGTAGWSSRFFTHSAPPRHAVVARAARVPAPTGSVIAAGVLPPAALVAAIDHHDPDARALAAAERSMIPTMLEMLANDPSHIVREAVAANPSTSPRVLERLASARQNLAERCAVAQNPACEPQLMERLHRDEHPFVRGAVARNPACPQQLLARLADDKEEWIAQDVVTNANCGQRLLSYTVQRSKPGSDLRIAAAANPGCDADMLELLADDSRWSVRRAVASNLRSSQTLIRRLCPDSDEQVRFEAAANPSSAPSLLTELSHSDDIQILAGVAANPSTHADVLRRMAQDNTTAATAVSALAGNAACPPDVLAQLLGIDDIDLRVRAKAVLVDLASRSRRTSLDP